MTIGCLLPCFSRQRRSVSHSNNEYHGNKHEERLSQGLCPSCGQQLYQIVSITGSNTQAQRIPLSIPRLVERGQCLQCLVNDNLTDSNTDTPSLREEEEEGNEAAAVLTNTNAKNIPKGQAVYQGDYNAQGQKHGQGCMMWSNGDVYHGSFVQDQRQGHGTLTFHNGGGEYVGQWLQNQMHGHGTRRFPNGDTYVGEYFHGVRQGPDGRLYYSNGDLHQGSWYKNQMHGPGRYYYASGQRFEGTFYCGKRHGKGKVQRTDGFLEIFQYVHDQRVGQGVRWSRDRSQAWRVWKPRHHKNSKNNGLCERKRISIAQAVSLGYEMEVAASQAQQQSTVL